MVISYKTYMTLNSSGFLATRQAASRNAAKLSCVSSQTAFGELCPEVRKRVRL